MTATAPDSAMMKTRYMAQRHGSRLTTQLALRNDNGRQEPRIHLNDTTCSSNISNSYDKKTTSQPYVSSFSDVPNRAQPSPPSINDFFSSNVLPAKRQPLQQHSFNAPAPAATSPAAAAAAAAAPPLDPFLQSCKHQHQPTTEGTSATTRGAATSYLHHH
jgi:hypothetical protein